jgi:hypothetical protein
LHWWGLRTRRPLSPGGVPARKVRRVRGRLSATRGPVVLRPRQTRPGLPGSPNVGLSGTLEGSPGPPCGARVAAISVPSPSSASRVAAVAGSFASTFGHLTGSGPATIAGASPLPVGSGLPELEPFALIPGADRCHVGR